MLPMPLISSGGVSVDDRIYVAGAGTPQGAYVYNALGEFQSTLESNRTLWDATLDSTGAYYTAGNIGTTDVFNIAKYNPDLTVAWVKETGSQTYAIKAIYDNLEQEDFIYVGTRIDGIKKYTTGGLLLWSVDNYLGDVINGVESIFNLGSNIYFTADDTFGNQYIYTITGDGDITGRFAIPINDYGYVDGFGIYTYGSGGELRKYDGSFNQLWSYNAGSVIRDLTTDPFGNIYIAIYTTPPTNDDFVRKLNSNGVVQWGESGFDYQNGTSVTLDSNYNVYVGASKNGDSGPVDFNLFKFTNDGNQQWFADATMELVYDIKTNF